MYCINSSPPQLGTSPILSVPGFTTANCPLSVLPWGKTLLPACYFWTFINIEYLQNSIYHIFNTNSTSLNVYLVVNSILVVILLRLSEGEIKPLLTYSLTYWFEPCSHITIDIVDIYIRLHLLQSSSSSVGLIANDIFENIDAGKITILTTALDIPLSTCLRHLILLTTPTSFTGSNIHLVSLVLSSPGFSHICFLAHLSLKSIRPHLPLPPYSQVYLRAPFWVHFFLFFLFHQSQTS